MTAKPTKKQTDPQRDSAETIVGAIQGKGVLGLVAELAERGLREGGCRDTLAEIHELVSGQAADLDVGENE